MPRFVLSDESVNKYGFRVLTGGIDLDAFRKNPVMFYNHMRSGSWDSTAKLPIGKWKDIKIESGKLTAEPEFDEADAFAQQIREKVEKGYLNAASIGFEALNISEEKEYILKGQTRPTVIKSIIYEASITDIPGNSNCLKMSFPSQGISLSGDVPAEILNTVLPEINRQLNMENKMERIAIVLGLAKDAGEEQIIAAISKKRETQDDTLVESCLSIGKAKGIVTDANRNNWETLARLDCAQVLSIFMADKALASSGAGIISEKIAELAARNGNPKSLDDRSKWTLTDWRRNDPEGLGKLQFSEPERYRKLLAELNLNLSLNQN